MNYLPKVNRKYRNGPTWRQNGRMIYRTTHSKHSIIKQNEEASHFDTIKHNLVDISPGLPLINTKHPEATLNS